MKTEGYIFKENLSLLYILFGIVLCFFISLWINNEAFPFGNKLVIFLFITIIIYLLLLAIIIWRKIKHPKLLIIDENGIHHYNSRITLSNNSTLWVDDYMFYSWDKINGFYFEWVMARGIPAYSYLVLEHEHNKAASIQLNIYYGRTHSYIDAIEECSGGRCVLNRAKYDKNRNIRNRDYLIQVLVFIAILIILSIFG